MQLHTNTSHPPMVSHAQNFEDVMLRRALGHLETGFYVDVGAWSPDLHSVTKTFYDLGWHGINIEPNPHLWQQYVQSRPRDTNLQMALSNTKTQAEMYFVSSSGLSSLDKNTATGYINDGYEVAPLLVNVDTLSNVLHVHATDRTHQQKGIHFLKIDVEGLEAQVLTGMDWQAFRPWVVLVEATLPNSQIENHQTWENTVLSAGYHFAYADGLNRWYVATEHLNLMPAFQYPPNVFDNYQLAQVVHLQAKLLHAEQLLAQIAQAATQHTVQNEA